jgi:DNA helicase-2/ATP-dependent DNA helicase PcrA
MNFDGSKEYLKQLNEAQRSAVLQVEGPVMIVAGAGSGKTRVLTYRIAHMLSEGIDSFNILALTFTNKAAKEMRHRIESLVGPEAKNLWMGTFHSIFAKILRAEADKLGYPSNFTIYDTDDSKSLIKSILKEMNLDDKTYKPGMVLNRISNAKNNLIPAKAYAGIDELTSYDSASGKPFIAQIYMEYAKRCFRAGAMDFDDLLLKTYELLMKHLDVLNKYQHKFKYIMVDEYQDTNHCQYMIVKKLAAVFENICVVGDDAQSIYSFRGATIQNILNFERDYPDMKVYKLEQNYRSTQTIVNAAGSVILRNKDQITKKVWTSNDLGEPIRLMKASTDNEEGKLIAESIFENRMNHQLANSDFAILYRTNAQSRSIEEALRKMNIPYRIYGGTSFYQRKEVKDVIAYLRLVTNHKDEESLKRVINYPARGIGKTSMERAMVLAKEHQISLWEIISNANQFVMLGAARSKLMDFATMIKSFATMMEKQDAYEMAMLVAKSTGLLKTLNDDKTVEGMSRYENLVELLNGIKEFVEDDSSEVEKTLAFYLQDIALLTDADKDKDDNNKVSLMTIHAAKGLEFPHVYISGLEENLFPNQMASGSRTDLEEERRLFYVGVTRAEKRLTLSFATSRFRFGNLLPCEPSRFLEEIDAEYIQFDPSSYSRNRSQRNANRFNEPPAPRTKQYGRETTVGSDQRNRNLAIPKNKPAAIPNFTPEDMSSIQESSLVEHQRFGKGMVVKIEGMGDQKKATIDFEEYGAKQLVLRFAKLRFIK